MVSSAWRTCLQRWDAWIGYLPFLPHSLYSSSPCTSSFNSSFHSYILSPSTFISNSLIPTLTHAYALLRGHLVESIHIRPHASLYSVPRIWSPITRQPPSWTRVWGCLGKRLPSKLHFKSPISHSHCTPWLWLPPSVHHTCILSSLPTYFLWILPSPLSPYILSTVDCGPPMPPANGSISNFTQTTLGATVLFECNPNFVPATPVTSICSSDVMWNPSPEQHICLSEFYS